MNNIANNLTISQKLLLSALAFALPIAVLLYYVVTGFNNTIAFSKKEIYGTQLLEPLSGLTKAIAERNAVARLAGAKYSTSKIEILDERIDSLFSQLNIKAALFGNYIDFNEGGFSGVGISEYSPTKIMQLWQNIRGSSITNYGASDFVKLKTGIEKLTRHTGDKSNLILDPDLDSYYLMDISLLVMPKMMEMLVELEYIAQKNSIGDTLNSDDLEKLHFYSNSIINDYLQRVRDGVAVSIREDINYYGESSSLNRNIPPAQSRYENSTLSFITSIRSIEKDTSHITSTRDITELARKAITDGEMFWMAALSELQTLLQMRIDRFENSRLLALLLSLATVAFAAFMIWITARGITKPLSSITEITTDIAGGDIQNAMAKLGVACKVFGGGSTAKAVTLKDETLRLFCAIKTMTANLDSLLSQVRQSGIQVTGSATQISSSARQLEAAITEQASSTNEVTATSKEISITSNELAGTMNNITQIAVESAELAEGGMAALEDMKMSLNMLKEASNDISTKLQLISDKTANISQVITTITKVANQTNLLSLNAAIEAEKAGEYGAGFSVVAREIRRLADQTSVAALEIEEMIVEMRSAVDEGVGAVEQNTVKTSAGSDNISSVIGDLSLALERIRLLGEQFETVNQGMQAQTEGALQISEAMQQLNEAALQTRSALFEMNDTAEKLSNAVSGLKRELGRFSISG